MKCHGREVAVAKVPETGLLSKGKTNNSNQCGMQLLETGSSNFLMTSLNIIHHS